MSLIFITRRMRSKLMNDHVTLLGAVLAAFVLLSTAKIGADTISYQDYGWGEGVGIVALGAILSATMLFWSF